MGSSTFHVDACCFTVILEHGVYTASWLVILCVCVRERERDSTSHACPLTTANLWQGLCRTPLCSPITKTRGCSRNGPHTCRPCADYTLVGPVLSPFLTSPPASPTASHGLGRPRDQDLSPCCLRCCPGVPRCGGSGCRLPVPVESGRPCSKTKSLRPPEARKSILPGKGIFLCPSQVFPKDPKEFAFAGLVGAFSLQLLENLFWSRGPQAPYCSWTLSRGPGRGGGWGQAHQKCRLSENHV